jgi:hypothetical protein
MPNYKPSKILQWLAGRISLMVGRFMNGVLLAIALIPCSQNGCKEKTLILDGLLQE